MDWSICEDSATLGRFAWLLAREGISLPPAPDSSEFGAACEFGLTQWQVLPAIADRLLNWGERHAAIPQAEAVRDRVVELHALSRVQLRICSRLIEEFVQRGIPYVMLKGTATRFVAYAHPSLRMGKDLDIAVPQRHLDDAKRAALACGFVAAQWNPSTKRFYIADPYLRARVEARHYELGFLVRRQTVGDLKAEEEIAIRRELDSQFIWHLTEDKELACYVSVDLHHGLSLDLQVEPLIKEAETHRWEGMGIRLPASEWILFHLVFKIYWEGVHNYGKGAYQYADLVRLLPTMSEAAFGRFVSLLNETRLEAAGFYVLRRLKRNLGLPLEPHIERFLDQTSQPPLDRDPIQANDLGDMWQKLWTAR